MTSTFTPSARTRLFPLLALLIVSAASAQEAGRYGHYDVYDPDNLPRAEYASRRAHVLDVLDSSTAMLVRSGPEQNRLNDVDYLYRQRNSMLYLTGVTEPESALLLVPKGVLIDGRNVTQILFVKERDPAKEIWLGVTMGPEVASQVTGITTALPFSRMKDIVAELAPRITTLYYDGWAHIVETEPLTGTSYVWDREMKKVLAAKAPSLHVKDVGAILSPMRVIKSPAEIALMRRAIDISLEGHRATISSAQPGMYEYELAATMESRFRRLGAEYTGYPSIVGSGPNSCILHYETLRRKSQPGELVLMDCGAEYHGYTADVTRTFPVSGAFSPEQRAIYDLVYRAQSQAIAECRAGAQFRDPHKKAAEIITAGLIELGIIAEATDYQKYFPHGTSHFLGLDVHDVGTMGMLKKGMVMTVEPGVYIAPGSPCDRKWWNIGVRIEDDILITDGDPVNLSGALPRSAAEIEKLMMPK